MSGKSETQIELEREIKSRLLGGGFSDFRLVDQSHFHSGHRGVVDEEGNKVAYHYFLEVVSSNFEGLSTIQRQRGVYALMKDLMPVPLHSLSLKTFTPEETSGVISSDVDLSLTKNWERARSWRMVVALFFDVVMNSAMIFGFYMLIQFTSDRLGWTPEMVAENSIVLGIQILILILVMHIYCMYVWSKTQSLGMRAVNIRIICDSERLLSLPKVRALSRVFILFIWFFVIPFILISMVGEVGQFFDIFLIAFWVLPFLPSILSLKYLHDYLLKVRMIYVPTKRREEFFYHLDI